MVLGTAKLRHSKSTMLRTTRGRDVSKEITKEFTIVFYETPKNRDSQLKIGWTEEKCIEMVKLAQEDQSYRLSREEYLRYQKTLASHMKQIGQECTDATSIRLPSRSHNQEPPPPRIRRRTCRTCYFSTVSKIAPFFLKFFMVELGHVHKLVELMSSIHF